MEIWIKISTSDIYLHTSISIAFPPVLPCREPAPSAIFDTEMWNILNALSNVRQLFVSWRVQLLSPLRFLLVLTICHFECLLRRAARAAVDSSADSCPHVPLMKLRCRKPPHLPQPTSSFCSSHIWIWNNNIGRLSLFLSVSARGTSLQSSRSTRHKPPLQSSLSDWYKGFFKNASWLNNTTFAAPEAVASVQLAADVNLLLHGSTPHPHRGHREEQWCDKVASAGINSRPALTPRVS